ncbi:cyclic GMP-AMP synthase-like receptor isoform X2 [Parasteatoda tepidariorum]|uniref:cyclic GMP-AMP synthase-like receptor isoform X2 n=1 Tax=Parasteatoda tepidariorum TaxID=114398 RepID=UPI001C722B18|nr:cyclic GMP-AMP synthase-like isoform X2 [Parasteatoda tepidariorum]
MGSNWSEEIEEEESDSFEEQDKWVLEAQKLKQPGVTICKEVLRGIKLDKKEEKENNEILKEFLRSFIDELKEVDELFNLLFKELSYEGSYYLNLRVSTPDEFDINLILKPPFEESEFEVVHQPLAPSYAKIYMKDRTIALEKYPKLAKTLFDGGYLVPENVRKWLQSVVDKALRTYTRKAFFIKRIRTKEAGPARTIILTKTDDTEIDIDLVPVVKCLLKLPESSLDDKVKNRVGSTLEFLRDKEDWKILASYYLKTVVMWMVIENNDDDYWKEDKMDNRFLDALQELKTAVFQKKIAYLFNKEYNLLAKINDDQACNIHNRLCYFIRKIKENPEFLRNVFQEAPSF